MVHISHFWLLLLCILSNIYIMYFCVSITDTLRLSFVEEDGTFCNDPRWVVVPGLRLLCQLKDGVWMWFLASWCCLWWFVCMLPWNRPNLKYYGADFSYYRVHANSQMHVVFLWEFWEVRVLSENMHQKLPSTKLACEFSLSKLDKTLMT